MVRGIGRNGRLATTFQLENRPFVTIHQILPNSQIISHQIHPNPSILQHRDQNRITTRVGSEIC